MLLKSGKSIEPFIRKPSYVLWLLATLNRRKLVIFKRNGVSLVRDINSVHIVDDVFSQQFNIKQFCVSVAKLSLFVYC